MLEELAARVGLSISRFKARFKEEVGMPPADYVARQKVARAMDLLRKTGMPVTQHRHLARLFLQPIFRHRLPPLHRHTPSDARRDAYKDTQLT